MLRQWQCKIIIITREVFLFCFFKLSDKHKKKKRQRFDKIQEKNTNSSYNLIFLKAAVLTYQKGRWVLKYFFKLIRGWMSKKGREGRIKMWHKKNFNFLVYIL